ncbi:MAG: tRNA epoxyqueuosine(34) reductase QueG [Anaerohalosphaera sp.]|nr:tRNA epoxyqueuosine(34) reductase QueG [Anaerohalosphaera sp.]
MDLGFDLVGITSAQPIDNRDISALQKWLERGFEAHMGYMRKNIDKRTDPSKLLADARSVICVALNYKVTASCKKPDKNKATVADFALYEDYHSFIKKRLFVLADFIKTKTSPGTFKFKACVDSVPLAERSLAERAGLGFIGKNRMLINPELGSNLFLAELICNLELSPDEPMEAQCHSCDKCVKACPTGALNASKGLDSNKCASYLTIEHRQQIPESEQSGIGNCLFGCDKCSSVCPFDINAPKCKNKDIRFFDQRRDFCPDALISWQQEDFDKAFKGSTVERLGLDLLKRNARICSNNLNAKKAR